MPYFRDGVPRKRNHNHRNYRGVTATVTQATACWLFATEPFIRPDVSILAGRSLNLSPAIPN